MLDKPNQFSIEEYAYKYASFQVTAVFRFQCGEIFTIMLKWPPLLHGRFVVDRTYPLYQFIAEWNVGDAHLFSLCFTDMLPHASVDLLIEPFIIGIETCDREIFPFNPIRMLWRRVRELLGECKNINATAGLFELPNYVRGRRDILGQQPDFVADPPHLQKRPGDHNNGFWPDLNVTVK
jgi:hypothetical protein